MDSPFIDMRRKAPRSDSSETNPSLVYFVCSPFTLPWVSS